MIRPTARLATSLGLLCDTALSTQTNGTRAWTNTTKAVFLNDTLSSSSPQSIQSTSVDHVPSTTGIGDYVALGLQLSGAGGTTPVTSSTSSASLSASAPMGVAPSLDHAGNASKVGNEKPAATSIDGQIYNTTQNGSCWDRWSAYWDSSASMTTGLATWTPSTIEVTEFAQVDTSTVFHTTATVTASDGDFAVETYITTETTTSYNLTFGAPTSTLTIGRRLTSGITTMPAYSNLPKPRCTLPSFVPQCQASWELWASRQYLEAPIEPNGPSGCAGTRATIAACSSAWSSWNSVGDDWDRYYRTSDPPCSQASISGSICAGLTSSYLGLGYEYYEGGAVGDATSSFSANGTTGVSTYWPTHTAFAPGCTLGCGGCQVSGRSVQLLYWPPATASSNNTNMSATAPAPAMLTSVGFGTTFTSPTVYISFDRLYASDSCTDVGPTYYNTIIPITDPSRLSSLWGYGHYNHLEYTAAFNFTDLVVKPVPNSIYNSQPRCASSSAWLAAAAELTGDPEIPDDFCTRTLPYEPIIAILTEVRELNPAWAHCTGGLRGAYDPPRALQGAASEQLPTAPGVVSTSTAQPASTPRPQTATITTQMTKSISTASIMGGSGTLRSDPGTPTPDVGSDGAPATSVKSTNSLSQDDSAQDSSSTHSSLTPSTTSGAVLEPSTTAAGSANAPLSSDGDDPDQDPTLTHVSQTDAVHQTDIGSTNALTILSQAEASDDPTTAQGSTVDTRSLATDNGVQSTIFSFTLDSTGTNLVSPIPAVSAAAPFTLTTDGVSLIFFQSSDSVVIAQGGTSGFVANGASTRSDGHEYSIVSSGGVVVADGTASRAFPSTTHSLADVVFSVGDQPVTAITSGGSVAIAQAGSTVTLAQGSSVAIGGLVYSVDSSADAIVVDSETSHALSSFEQPPATAVFSMGTALATAQIQGNNIILDGPSTTATLVGGSGIFGGQSIILQTGGSALVVGSQTVNLPNLAAGSSGTQTTSLATERVWTANGAILTAVPDGSSVLILESDSAVTLAGGAETTFDGHTFSAPTGIRAGTILGPGSSTSSLQSIAKVATLAENGRTLTVSATGNGVVILEGGGTVTIADGSSTTLAAGEVASVPTLGGALVLGGSETVQLDSLMQSSTSTAPPTDTGGLRNTRQGPAATATTITTGDGSVVRRPQVVKLFVWSLLAVLLKLVVAE